MRVTSILQRITPIGVAVLFLAADGFASSPLLDAARNVDRDAIRTLLDNGADVNAPAGDGSTALLWTCYRDDLESAELLLRAGADANAANDLGVTALWAASQNGNTAIVRRLLRAGAIPDAALLKGETPIMVAARAGFRDVVELLASKTDDVDARGSRGQTALMWAAAQGNSDVVEVLLAHGADVNARSESWSQVMAVPPHGYPGHNRAIPHGGNTALLFAARAGDLDSARLLVNAGADVNDADAWGVSVTVLAAHSGFRELVEFFLEQEADPNLAAAGFSALHIAIMRRDEQMARALLAHGADPNAPLQTWTPRRRSSKDFYFPPELVGATPFWLAARFSQPDVMRLLVKRGADPLFVHRAEYVKSAGMNWPLRKEETTVLMAATGMGGGKAWVQPPPLERELLILETVKLVTELGADVNATNTDGETALDAARAWGYESVTEFLITKGAR